MQDKDCRYPTSNRGFHVCHLNCQSISDKLDVVKYYVNDSQFDIFSLSETWLTPDHSDQLLNVDGYDIVRLDRNWTVRGTGNRKKGGGVAAYISNRLSYSATELEGFNVSSDIIEIMWLMVRIPNMRKIIVGILYRPPHSNAKLFCEILTDKINNLPNSNRSDVFILGDYNIDYSDTKCQSRKYLKELESL